MGAQASRQTTSSGSESSYVSEAAATLSGFSPDEYADYIFGSTPNTNTWAQLAESTASSEVSPSSQSTLMSSHQSRHLSTPTLSDLVTSSASTFSVDKSRNTKTFTTSDIVSSEASRFSGRQSWYNASDIISAKASSFSALDNGNAGSFNRHHAFPIEASRFSNQMSGLSGTSRSFDIHSRLRRTHASDIAPAAPSIISNVGQRGLDARTNSSILPIAATEIRGSQNDLRASRISNTGSAKETKIRGRQRR